MGLSFGVRSRGKRCKSVRLQYGTPGPRFTRSGRPASISHSEPPPSAPIECEDELWFCYTGLKYRSTFFYEGTYLDRKTIDKPGLDQDRGAVCLAVLRKDGFVSLDPFTEEGT